MLRIAGAEQALGFIQGRRKVVTRLRHQARGEWFEEQPHGRHIGREGSNRVRFAGKRYQANPTAAQAYLELGESPRDERLEAAEHAAWAQVGALILNLSEFVTRT